MSEIYRSEMKLADLCHDGLENYKKFEIYAEAFRIHGRIQSFAMMHERHQKFLEHLEDCELCMPMEDAVKDE